MNLHVHPRFYLHGILEGAGRHRDRIPTQHRGIALRIDLFVDAVPIQIGAKIECLTVELWKGRRYFQRKTDDLIGYELFF